MILHMRVETSTMYDRLIAAVGDAKHWLRTLEPLLAEPESNGPDTGTIGRSAPESSEPWAKQAAGAYFDLYFGAREMARVMRGAKGLRRPIGDEACGPAGLDIVRNMAPSAEPFILRGVTRKLERWVRAAEQIDAIDEAEPWVPLPRAPDGVELACPYCHTYGLRMLKRKGEVRCVFPGCHDDDGNPTRARMERGRLTGDGILIFGDGTTMGGAV
jgi:hypothetical protein